MKKLNCSNLINNAKEFTQTIIKKRLSRYRKIIDSAIVIVTGSVSLGLADEYSDIDYGILLQNHSDFTALKRQLINSIGDRFLEYKGLFFHIHLSSLRLFCAREETSSNNQWWETIYPTDIFTIQHAVIIQIPNKAFRSLKAKARRMPPEILTRRIIGRWGLLNREIEFRAAMFQTQ